MSRFSGKQFKGAARVLKETRRKEAETRQKKFAKEKFLESIEVPADDVVQPGVNVDELIKNENPGPALPGLAKRARKITRKTSK